MDKWRLYQRSRPNRLRSCQSTVGMATWGCRSFTSRRTLPSPAGSSPSQKATTSTAGNTTSPCKIPHHGTSRWFFPTRLQVLLFPFLSSTQPTLLFFLFHSHIRWGAPPVINPTGSLFPNATLWRPSLSLILPVTSQSSTTLNVSNPAAGEWYVAAHLPEDDGRIEQKVSGTGWST